MKPQSRQTGIMATIIHIRLIFALAVVINTASRVQGCWYGEVTCANGECIKAGEKCDGHKHCSDGSDETTETCGTNCEKVEGRFACSNGQCKNIHYKCNGRTECPDGSDETIWGCAQDCPEGYFKCSYGKCITASKKCDGHKDCSDGSDEATETCEVTTVVLLLILLIILHLILVVLAVVAFIYFKRRRNSQLQVATQQIPFTSNRALFVYIILFESVHKSYIVKTLFG